MSGDTQSHMSAETGPPLRTRTSQTHPPVSITSRTEMSWGAGL